MTGTRAFADAPAPVASPAGPVPCPTCRPRWRHRRPPTMRRRAEMPLWLELPVLLLVAFCLAVLVRSLAVQAFFIPSGSMEQTLQVGDRVLVDKVVFGMRAPMRGEVVVFRGTGRWKAKATAPVSQSFPARLGRTLGDLTGADRPGEKDYIKRVIGVPGDRVSCCDPRGRVVVNGRGVDEPYVFDNARLPVAGAVTSCGLRPFAEVRVPPGRLWVMGDHRGNSLDARCHGPVRIDDVIGRAFVLVWPRERFSSLPVPPVWHAWNDNPAAAPTR